MKTIFEIEWDDELGEAWMNEDNLLICLNTKEHCGEGLILNVKEAKNKVFSIGQAAKMCAVTVKQLRHWGEKGYIPESDRVACGKRSYRKYGEEDLELIQTIKTNLDKGYTLTAAAERAKKIVV